MVFGKDSSLSLVGGVQLLVLVLFCKGCLDCQPNLGALITPIGYFLICVLAWTLYFA